MCDASNVADDGTNDGNAGQVSGPQKMQHIVDRNQEVLNNFIKAIEELAILRDNLLKKEVRHAACSLVSCQRNLLLLYACVPKIVSIRLIRFSPD